uniref:Ephrin B2 n=1 Tax=Acanthochromis polyacanthus TaxID=80966 RepID=A0A3Q1FYP2_9TELE
MGRRTWSCAAVILLAVICSCRAATLESVHWSSSNAKFASGRGLVLYPQIGDKMDIVCPRADASPGGKEEFYRVYLVSKSQLASCTIDKTDTPLLNCDKPHRDVKFTFKFQEFSPNLWGLEFLKGKDYYITSTSTGSLQGLDNNNGGVCRTKSMKLVLRVGQSKHFLFICVGQRVYKAGSVDKTRHGMSEIVFKSVCHMSQFASSSQFLLFSFFCCLSVMEDAGQTNPSSDPGLLVWIVSGCVVLVLVIAVVLVVLWRYHRRRCIPDTQQSASVSLNTLAVPKRDSISSDNAGSDRSDVVFPLRASDSMICRHYERVSGDYGPPVYIVQEIMPQCPTNIYYKV